VRFLQRKLKKDRVDVGLFHMNPIFVSQPPGEGTPKRRKNMFSFHRKDRVMAIFRTLFVLSVLLFSAGNLLAQTTWYVRDGGAGLANGTSAADAAAQIADIAANLNDGDVIDIGEGVFDGATIEDDVHIAGVDAGNAGPWGLDVTVLNAPIQLSGANQTVTIEGVRWGYNVVPVEQYGAGDDLVPVLRCSSNQCKQERWLE
jgi:hypothetical protein